MSKEIGLRIRQLRELRGLTQRQFAAFLDIASSSISQFEAGRNVPGGEMLTKLHTKLGVDINWLLTGTPAAGAPAEQQLPPRIAALVDNFRHMTEPDKSAFERQAFALAQPNAKTRNG